MKRDLLFVFIQPLDEGGHSASAVADLAGEFCAFAAEEDDGWEALDFVFLGEGLVSGFLFLGLLCTAGEIEFHGDEVRAREFLEGGLGKDIGCFIYSPIKNDSSRIWLIPKTDFEEDRLMREG